ncbi:MAG: FtsQ-type POTRA domain-containing protein [Pseudomonadota bacterium]
MPKLAANAKKRAANAGGKKAKKRWTPATLAQQLRNTAIGAGILLVGALTVVAIKTDLPQRLWVQTIETGWAISGNAGLRVEELVVYGLHRTSAGDARAAIAIDRGTPILRVDMREAHTRLTSLPWVERASIRRQLPDKIVVAVEERQALAIWRNGRRLGIIDTAGEPIMPVVPRGLEHLPLVTGDFANEAAPDLIASLKRLPDLQARITASTRVAGHRWDLVMDNGVVAHLPAEGLDAALDELIALIKDEAVIERDLLAIDLRQSDRVLLDLPPDVTDALAAARKEKS